MLHSCVLLNPLLGCPLPSEIFNGEYFEKGEFATLFLSINPKLIGVDSIIDGTTVNDSLDKSMALMAIARQRFKNGRQPASMEELAPALPKLSNTSDTLWTVLCLPAGVAPLVFDYEIYGPSLMEEEISDPFVYALRSYWEKNLSVPDGVEPLAPYAKDRAQLESWKERFATYPQTTIVCAIRVPSRAFYHFTISMQLSGRALAMVRDREKLQATQARAASHETSQRFLRSGSGGVHIRSGRAADLGKRPGCGVAARSESECAVSDRENSAVAKITRQLVSRADRRRTGENPRTH